MIPGRGLPIADLLSIAFDMSLRKLGLLTARRVNCFEVLLPILQLSVRLQRFSLVCTLSSLPQMHSDTHDHFGGAFNCAMDVRNFHDEHPEYSPEMLTFVFMTVTGLWNKQLMSDYNDCDTQCERGTSEPCGCTCTIDAFTVSEDLVRNLVGVKLTLTRVHGVLVHTGQTRVVYGYIALV